MKKFFLKTLSIIFLFVFYLFSYDSYASEQSLIDFSNNKQWLKLLHYKKINPFQSHITSKSFFLNGTTNNTSLGELKSTIFAIYAPVNINKVDNHAQCRFPARFTLIKEYVDLSSYGELPLVNCPKYNKWKKQIKKDTVSLIFASGYMSNPASMYGHLLLKFTGNNKGKNSELLDESLNYGAIVPTDENPLLYILRGIFGGYDASFSDQQFFKHKHNYGNVELRDMWEYKLALTNEDVALLVDHLWEILPVKFDYYFIDENCAYHFAKLIELVLDEPIIKDDTLWVLPNSVITGLANAKYKKQSLLTEVNFIPSRESLLFNYFDQLTTEQKIISQTIIDHNFSFDTNEYQALNSHNKKIIIETLFQYINVIKEKNKQLKTHTKAKQRLINERLKLSIGRAIDYQGNNLNYAPHLAQKSSKTSIGVVGVDDSKFYNTAGFRMTYFDNLSSTLGLREFSNLEMIDVELITDYIDTKIVKFDLIDVSSLYLPAIPWSQETASAWSVRAGYEQLRNSCIDCGIYFAEGGRGKSIRIAHNTLAYALIGGKAFSGEKDDVVIYAKVGYLTSLTKSIKARVEIQKQANILFSNSYTSSIKLAFSYEFSNDWDIRLQLENKESTLTSLAVNYYWGF